MHQQYIVRLHLMRITIPGPVHQSFQLMVPQVLLCTYVQKKRLISLMLLLLLLCSNPTTDSMATTSWLRSSMLPLPLQLQCMLRMFLLRYIPLLLLPLLLLLLFLILQPACALLIAARTIPTRPQTTLHGSC